MKESVFGVSRGIWEDPDFKSEPFTQREAFMWLVSEAAWRDRKVRAFGGPVALRRGEVCHSIRFMAAAWKWDKAKVSRFLDMLKKRDTIEDSKRDGHKIYFIKKYNKFQVVGLPKRDTKRNETETEARQDRDKLEEGETLKKDNSKRAPTPRSELETVLDAERTEAVIEHRQRLRKPLTARAAKLLVGKLSKADDPNAAADCMVANGWAGFEVEWMARRAGSDPPKPLGGFGAALDAMDRDLTR